MDRQIARGLRRAAPHLAAADRVTLDYEGRFLRRRTLITDSGASLLVDLPETVSLDDGDALVTETGALVLVRAAPEPLIEITAAPLDLARLAWHVGNRHAPAQIEPGRILIQANHVVADMLARLGAAIRDTLEPFTPEGGAYGHGRTLGHHHGGSTDDPHDHAHEARRHAHDQPHERGRAGRSSGQAHD